MSCYEWESGTIKIPSKEWAGFKKDLREAYNQITEDKFNKAMQVYERLMEKAKGRRKVTPREWEDWFQSVLWSQDDHYYAVSDAVGLSFLLAGTKSRPKRPQKKNFPKANGKTVSFDVGGEATIYLNSDKSKSVLWDVPENNHAREHAREEPLAEKFFSLLNRITWTRGSGGKIIGNDEYNRDSGHECEGGGGSYLVEEYGPAKKQTARRSYY